MPDIDISQFTPYFDDEFESLDLQSDSGIWRTSYYDGDRGRTHGDELQIYADYTYLGLNINPFSIADGVLTIHAQNATPEAKAATGYDYTSGMLSSSGAFSQTYGYFEIRCDTPEIAGTWPAFWLLPANGSWPPELDVFEALGSDTSKVYTTVHSAQTGTHVMTGISAALPDRSDGMHTYGVLWTKDDLVWYIDGQEVYRTATPDDMHQPMYMVTNLAVGGWAGHPGADFEGADYKIDYIRTYTLDSTPYPNIVTSDHSFVLDKVADGLILTGTADISGTGNALDNSLTGNAGNNVLDGRLGADAMAGGAGNDIYYVDDGGDTVAETAGAGSDRIVSSVSLTLAANVETLILAGASNLNGAGNDLANTLGGNAGNNLLDGAAGADAMAGGAGDDTYRVDNAGDIVSEWSGQGSDTVYATVSFSLLTHAENLVLTGSGNTSATGNWLDNALAGNAGNNVLDGGAGNDSMAGGLGNDSYRVDSTGDVVTEASAAGCDTVMAATGSYRLGANVEKLVLTSAWSANGHGNTLDNTLTGNAAANSLDGGSGADTMIGGAGSDTYYVDSGSDVITEWYNQGTDKVFASVSLTLSANVETLTLTGAADLDGAGNALANTLNGNAGNNLLDGGAGADSMAGGRGNDRYTADNSGDVITEWYDQGIDTVYAATSYKLGSNLENLALTGSGDMNATGNELGNVLTGNAGNNILDGGAGSDSMAGGLGGDTYMVDSTGDAVTEGANAGSDTVMTSLGSYALGANVEKLVLTSAWSASGTGNALDNTLTGNAAANSLDGGAGADAMIGGAGDDTYYVDNAGDVVTEWSNQGTDRVLSSISLTLAANVERLILTGASNVNATGNGLGNTLTGNGANNILDGGAGADAMAGGYGSDSYHVDSSGDVVTEWYGQGVDTVYSSVSYALGANLENLILTGAANLSATGNDLGDTLTGNSGNNGIDGGGGADVLIGGLGADTLRGGAGNDRFVFASTAESAIGGRDTVSDFASGDSIDLSGAFDGTLSYRHTGAFTGKAGEVQVMAEGSGVAVDIDIDGDRAADMQIYLQNIAISSLASNGANFIL